MRQYIWTGLLLTTVFFSCQNNNETLIIEKEKAAQRNEVIFKNINKAWFFEKQQNNLTSRNLTNTWTEWRIFLNELEQKPKSTIGAFQQKAKNLSKKSADLNQNIPEKWATTAIKSRIMVLITVINSLDLYIHLNPIPDKKVVAIIAEINKQSIALQDQMDEIEIKTKIQAEAGEGDLIKMLDPSRAVPTLSSDTLIKKH
ncbi:hypothetical protein B0A58_13460 [Flavobacterium branchiophilum NBRC 15030 = ATCC 35035]|nr:hypothetical protein B0A58_13460 [Flavobacterium branchiophilum NBRC 15030 = ATCC 35035]TQM39319.1 hypothetical protein BC670_0103 [Flavobacterium branchiophilum]